MIRLEIKTLGGAGAPPAPPLDPPLRELMFAVIRQHLLRAKQRMKRYADGHRSERQFQVNDWVFLKLQPYVQSSVADISSQKLPSNFLGPTRC